jgi:hypothetical protein
MGASAAALPRAKTPLLSKSRAAKEKVTAVSKKVVDEGNKLMAAPDAGAMAVANSGGDLVVESVPRALSRRR